MSHLTMILIILFFISIIINYTYLISKKSAIQIINEMGIGYNLGNSFDCYLEEEKESEDTEKIAIDIDSIITSKGNPIPTKKLILSLKKYGFKTIRFPITWINFIDDKSYKVNPDWMKRVKEVVDLVVNENLYCIINVHNDGKYGYWLSQGLKVRDKYIYLWTQIANEFKNYDEYLIFESMNSFMKFSEDGYGYDFDALNKLNQIFVDTVRKSGGNNIDRLLLISGVNNDFESTFSVKFKMPIDPSNKLAISFRYYIPYDFVATLDNEFSYSDEYGVEHSYSDLDKFGSDADYNEMINNFEKMKAYFVDKGIPAIIGEVGVFTEENKEIESVREYLYSIFSMASNYNGIMACLWDTSNKTLGNMNFYNRKTNEWYDINIRDNFKKISKGNYVKPLEYTIMTNTINYDIFYKENLDLKIGDKKLLKLIFNARANNYYLNNCIFYFVSNDKNGDYIFFQIGDNYRKKEYDGSYTYTIDMSGKDLNNFLELDNYFGYSYNYLTLIFKDKFISIDTNAYRQDILKFIN